MLERSVFSQRERAKITREFASLQEIARRRCPDPDEFALIRKAFEFADHHLDGFRRLSGDPLILHSIAVAQIVVGNIGLGHNSICAALLYEVPSYTDCTVQEISVNFTQRIASFVNSLQHNLHNDSDLENEDMRVVLIELAKRLHNCRTIEFLDEDQRHRVLDETMQVYIPLAHRLGMYAIKSEMENIWLRFNHSQMYNDINEKLNSNAKNSDKRFSDFLSPICSRLQSEGISFTTQSRVKTPYSIWYKMQHKKVRFDQISDLYAVRIVFSLPEGSSVKDERNECYHIFSLITSIYSYKPERVRDWLEVPKSNGYEALHLTARSADGTDIEVQIRSARMNDIAERGIAAHWSYKQQNTQE